MDVVMNCTMNIYFMEYYFRVLCPYGLRAIVNRDSCVDFDTI